MRSRLLFVLFTAMALLAFPGVAFGAKNVTSSDSTQPRGLGGPDDPLNDCSEGPVYNDHGQDLCPIDGGIWTPFYYLGNPDDGQGSQARYFETWKGMAMGNGARDPAFFAMLSTVNRDQINLLNAAALACYPDGLREPTNDEPCASAQEKLWSLLGDPGTSGKLPPVAALNYIGLYVDEVDGLDPVIHVDLSKYPYVLQPEDRLPVAADLCLRCHFTGDWLEGRSEPPTSHAPYLRGQFWGAAFREYPGWPGDPELLVPEEHMFTDIQAPDSEAGMEGIQCMYCHRQNDNYKRTSLYDGSTISRGIGGYFMIQQDPYWSNAQIRPTSDFQKDPFLCGTCHDVTNPLIKEQNTALTSGTTTDYPHPIERTFTEWYWSDHGPGGGSGGGHCERCHEPMVFQGAQTWLLEGLDELWGEVDRKWKEAPYYYNAHYDFSSDRGDAYYAAAQRSRDLVAHPSDGAEVDIEDARLKKGTATVTVRITNNAGHKIPTGFAEGRQMWVNLKAVDEAGNVIYESGIWDDIGDVKGLYRYFDIVNGELVARSESIKVYEHVSLAKNYDPFTLPDQNGCDNWNILDYTTGDPFDGSLAWEADCSMSHFDKEFHFVLLNYVEKDNRIPPRGWIPEAYAADGAFVVDNGNPDYGRYLDDRGRPINYDDTTFTFDTSQAEGDITVTAKVMYQTFNEHFMEYLEHLDKEKMLHAGGRARNAPCTDRNPRDGSTAFCGYETWGTILYDIWAGKNFGQPVQFGKMDEKVIK
ncbi:MAG: hypothetical protein JSV80_04805 [Acidobacteriota bacterium]|nr:MAG: hypothetical protein JSV80_04805 [Acidobacteriota bacterium]